MTLFMMIILTRMIGNMMLDENYAMHIPKDMTEDIMHYDKYYMFILDIVVYIGHDEMWRMAVYSE